MPYLGVHNSPGGCFRDQEITAFAGQVCGFFDHIILSKFLAVFQTICYQSFPRTCNVRLAKDLVCINLQCPHPHLLSHLYAWTICSLIQQEL